MANMFSDNVEKKVPKNLKECYATDNTSQNLWLWCERLEGWGKFLFWFIIVSGLIMAIASSITVREVTKGLYYTYTDTETAFNFAAFITTLVSTAIYAFVEYCVYHVLALLISSLATIVQNTRITANVTIYNAAKEEGILNEEPEKTTPSAPKQNTGYSLSELANKKTDGNDSWICKECGTKNDVGNLYCKDCGKYK